MPSPVTHTWFPHPVSAASIVALQNDDGGWGYSGGPSWTEPTAYALLAQAVEGTVPESFDRGMQWLRRLQRADGGWPPQASVDHSTWVTALAVLLLADRADSPGVARAVNWLLQQTGRESTFLYRLRLKLLGARTEAGDSKGWPWFPETAAWVLPTALTILSLQKVNRRWARADIQNRIEMGRRFLLAKMCEDGGWNHGSSRALGYEADSYPETTGLALLALHGVQSPKLVKAFAAAERHLRQCRSTEGLSWLLLGLLAHSRSVKERSPGAPARTVVDASLSVLARNALRGTNVLLE